MVEGADVIFDRARLLREAQGLQVRYAAEDLTGGTAPSDYTPDNNEHIVDDATRNCRFASTIQLQ